MIELRKVVVFLFVTILLFYMLRLLYFSKKKWQFRTYAFIMLLSGLVLVEIATFLDVLASLLKNPFIYVVIKTAFTIGSIIYIIGIILWGNFTTEMMSKLENLSLRDSMTGVLNRNGIEKIYQSLIKSKTAFYVIVCDLDGTKRINDTYGHIEGDKFIDSTTKIISYIIEPEGYLARIGGDEFVILLGCEETEDIQTIIWKIKNQVSRIHPEQNVGISLGYSLYPNDGITFKELINLADERMYTNKKSIR